ncbi:uncharacterized protein LOC62_02G002232 [Vanrija pseudolonga]|uniref:Uncharacterized protein n=1 Tax=Vanrija pseudolonga TaxID=143232 RepID=A0AAF0Y1V7_9TREE|nr:hypothetical protein LOC62_02G002232 [Vanrija pseudolonga]
MPSPPRSPRESGEVREPRGGYYNDSRPSGLPPRPRSPPRRSASPPYQQRPAYSGSGNSYRSERERDRSPGRTGRPSDPRRRREDPSEAGPSRNAGWDSTRATTNKWPKPRANSPGYYSPPSKRRDSRDPSPLPNPVSMDDFTTQIYNLLTARTRQAQVQRHLDRLKAFNTDGVALRDAQRQAADLNNEVRIASEAVGAGFNDLLRRALSRPGVRDGDTAALEIEGLRQRILQLEQSGPPPLRIAAPPSSTPPPPSQEPPPPPPDEPTPTPPLDKGKGKAVEVPTDAEPSASSSSVAPAVGAATKDKSVEGKRDRVRQMLLDLVTQVSTVQGRVDNLDEKFDELENEINVRDYDSTHRVRSWEQYQRRNDPNGRLTGQPRLVVDKKDDEMPTAREPSVAAAVVAEAEAAAEASAAGPSTAAVEPAQDDWMPPMLAPTPTPAPVDQSENVLRLATEMVRMQKEIQQLRDSQAASAKRQAEAAAGAYTTAAASILRREVETKFETLKAEVLTAVEARVDALVPIMVNKTFSEIRPNIRDDVYRDVVTHIKDHMRNNSAQPQGQQAQQAQPQQQQLRQPPPHSSPQVQQQLLMQPQQAIPLQQHQQILQLQQYQQQALPHLTTLPAPPPVPFTVAELENYKARLAQQVAAQQAVQAQNGQNQYTTGFQ